MTTPADIFAAFASLGVRLPLRLSDEDAGVVVDADGRDVLTVDVNGEIPDKDANGIAALAARIVNEAAGCTAAPAPPLAAAGGGYRPQADHDLRPVERSVR